MGEEEDTFEEALSSPSFSNTTALPSTLLHNENIHETGNYNSRDIEYILSYDNHPTSYIDSISFSPDQNTDEDTSNVSKCYDPIKILLTAIKTIFVKFRCIFQKSKDSNSHSSNTNCQSELSKHLRQEIEYSLNAFVDTIDGPCNHKTHKNSKYVLVMNFLKSKKK